MNYGGSMKTAFFTKLFLLLPAVFSLFSCSGKGSPSAPSGGFYFMEPGGLARAGQMYLDGDGAAENFNTNEFDHITDNPFLRPRENPLSTFSIDVDTAGYSIVRTFLNRGSLRGSTAGGKESSLPMAWQNRTITRKR